MKPADPVIRWGLMLLVPVTVIAVLFAIWIYRDAPIGFGGAETSESGELPVIGTVPAFELTNQDGDAFPASELADEVWIADFIFTRCSGPCPRMTLGLRELQDVLESNEDARLVSITVDPDFDTPQVLKEYAEGYGANLDRWTFLTGPSKTVRDLARNGFYLGSPELTDAEGRVVHSIYFALVDRKGQIRGYYNGLEEPERKRLAADVRRLLEES